ncbi:MAG: type I polyketide synthase [Nostoc sp. ChiSLP02]|nr:type I polyketide synthase [Nostoc sp. DedSLP05]MDZ8102846.1 type I polyketide synthase [Nostoc sp. DedSLP01]MDZ8184143.1 type I polyketide synthase [Nostoc sp. ChiSLP02]
MEPVAIIGIGCRFPGANNPEAFWHLLRNGIDAISEVPVDRWDIEKFYHPQPGTPGKMNTRFGGFIEQVDKFDPDLFGISPREAKAMDPQQRLVLEVAWEALENAGIVPAEISGSQTGVVVGIGNYDYGILSSKDLDRISAYHGTGNTISIAATRLSYLLNLKGPSFTIETACSSSLVALHQACQSLRNQETDLFVVGAVSLMLSPQQTITYSNAHMMAGDGRCKTFDAKANGYVRGEGCGVIVLKRLADAIRDGDNIQAIIRGSAVNQDGLSNGMTAPNGSAQQAVIRQALQNAGVEPSQISYIEAHGTGTSLGDPIEIKALKTVLIQGRSSEQPCWIGSVKTNIGHLEAAAGMAGLLKVVLALKHQQIPPHLNLQELNPLISFAGTPFAIPCQLQPWQVNTPRFAGISSFGFGGTNAHVILEEGRPQQQGNRSQEVDTLERPLHLLTLSAKTPAALSELAQRYTNFLDENPELALADICYTANTKRSQFEHRLAVLAKSNSELQQQLQLFAAGTQATGVVTGQAQGNKRRKIAFLFTGQGSQYAGMGQKLYQTQAKFRQTIDQCDQILKPYLDKPLLEVLYPQPGITSPIDNTNYTQAALFALEYALYQLWQSWGIKPDIVLGHSVGEYVAACVAGVFSLEDGLKLIAARGRLMQALPENGSMVAVMATVEQLQPLLAAYSEKIAIAAVNGARSLVISGEKSAISEICSQLASMGIKTKPLQVSHAFHSPLMQPMLADFMQVANSIKFAAPKLKLISNLTGELATQEIATPEYWCRHILSPVEFAASIATLEQQKVAAYVEIGPKPILLGMGRECVTKAEGLWLPSLRPGQDDWQVMLSSLAQLHCHGVAVDWQGFDAVYERMRLHLPTYPFQRQRFWVESKSEQKTDDLVQSSIVKLLHQGNVEQLTQQLASQLSADEQIYLPKLLEVLVKQHHLEIASPTIPDWFYQIAWQPQSRRQSEAQVPQQLGSWLILGDRGGLGQAIAQLLENQGHRCILVYPGDVYQQQETTTWSVNPAHREDFSRLLQEALPSGELPWRGVIHLWNLETTQTTDFSLSGECISVLHLIGAIAEYQQPVTPTLWLVTRGAMSVNSSLPAVQQSPVWGVGKVVALEHPELWGGMIDLDPQPTANEALTLLAEINDAQKEDHLAFRSGQRYVARLVPMQPTASSQTNFNYDGTYLITGGLGALGLKLAEWLVNQGVKSLVLLGRRGASSEAQATISKMQAAGIKILIAQADVSNKTDMLRVLETVAESMPPLKGVIHAAGVVGYDTITGMDLTTWESILRPKVLGGWILHQLTENLELDLFVSFSSIASVWGSKGQAHYAAANHFLDTLANYRRSKGLPALSVNWGPWAEVGMAVGEAEQFLARMGVQALQPQLALNALGVALKADASQVTIANIDWTVFKGIYEARGQRLLLEKLGRQVQENTGKAVEKKSEILQKLATATVNERQIILIAYLQTQISQVLGMSELPETHRGFFEMGIDSLMAVDLKTRLETALNCSLPGTLLFEAPNIQDLATYLGKEVLHWQDEQQEVETEPTTDVLEITHLSDDELEASIAERLAQLESLIG